MSAAREPRQMIRKPSEGPRRWTELANPRISIGVRVSWTVWELYASDNVPTDVPNQAQVQD